MQVYRSPYEAYPFLADPSEDYRCDFEIMTDRLSSMTGILAAMCQEETIRAELLRIDELIYHLNPSLRTKTTITEEEVQWLHQRVEELKKEGENRFQSFCVLPQGSVRGSLAHVIRADCKALVRLLHRHEQQGHETDHRVIDFANLLSGYFFGMAVWLNGLDQVEECPFKSRNYPKVQ